MYGPDLTHLDIHVEWYKAGCVLTWDHLCSEQLMCACRPDVCTMYKCTDRMCVLRMYKCKDPMCVLCTSVQTCVQTCLYKLVGATSNSDWSPPVE